MFAVRLQSIDQNTHTTRMLRLGNTHRILPLPLLLLLAALWSPGATSRAWSGLGSSKDPNVRDWGDYSDLPAAVLQGPEMDRTTHNHGGAGGSTSWSLPLAPELDFLAEFAGKSKLTSFANVCRFFDFFLPLAFNTNSIILVLPSRQEAFVGDHCAVAQQPLPSHDGETAGGRRAGS